MDILKKELGIDAQSISEKIIKEMKRQGEYWELRGNEE